METPKVYFDSEEIKSGIDKEVSFSLNTEEAPALNEDREMFILKSKNDALQLEIREEEDALNDLLEKLVILRRDKEDIENKISELQDKTVEKTTLN
ncbi:MAG: hypothetical protein KBC11_02000 [Candidatus Pacebacteria bacterium]|nr:hypothetical protein [Candidatus Paceibacterota bacterium]